MTDKKEEVSSAEFWQNKLIEAEAENDKLSKRIQELEEPKEIDAFKASNVYMMRSVHNTIADYINQFEILYRERIFADTDTSIVDTIKELKIRENTPDHFLYLCRSIEKKRNQFDVLIDAENRLKMHKSIMVDLKSIASHLGKFQYFKLVDPKVHFE